MRNHRNLTGLMGRLAVEELEEIAVVPGEEVAAEPVEAGVDSLESDLCEINDELVEVQDDEDSTTAATDVVDELEVAVEALRIIASNGGLDRNGAQILNLHIDSLQQRAGYPANHKTLSVEAFGATNSRIGQTTLAIESIADKAKELWKQIVEMFKRALASLGALWNKVFDGATRLKARAENTLKAAEAAKGEKAAETFEQPKLAEALHINGAVDVKAAATVVEGLGDMMIVVAEVGMKAAQAMTASLENGDLAKLKTSLVDLRKNANGDLVSDPATVGMSAPGEGLELLRGEEALPGNRAIIAIVPKDENTKADMIGKCGYKLGTFDASKKVGDKVALKVLTPDEAKAVAKQMIAAADSLLKYKPEQKKTEDIAKKVITLAEKKAGEAPKEGESAEGKLSSADARALAKGAMAMTTAAAPPLAVYLLNTAGSVLQYVEQSIKQYGKAKAEAPAAKPAEKAAPAAAAA